MSTPATPSAPKPAGDDRNLVPADASPAPTLEDRLQSLWEKNRNAIIGACVLVLAVIVGKGIWERMERSKHEEIGKAYGAAATSDQLRTFSAAHASHPLGGIAHLRLADEAYAAGKFTDAIAGYDKAVVILADNPLGARARLGRATAKAQAGKAAEATTELKAIADDTKLPKAVRGEAAYHLTGLAVEAGNATEAQKFVDLLTQLDPDPRNPWTGRAMMLRATLPAAPAPAAPAPAAGEKKADAAAPAVKVEIPKK
ncbi:MAG: tetratricopeptide repeat protein [Opitutaceae bacterium]|nr:tetratricopeptide repeat protein [Opitutaceae bacterium]